MTPRALTARYWWALPIAYICAWAIPLRIAAWLDHQEMR